MGLFGTQNDAADPQTPTSLYKTNLGHPWGIHTADSRYQMPAEEVDVTKVYIDFATWAESGGTEKADWYIRPDSNFLLVP
ncbi:MAG: hypothetical protein CL521_01770 [Actinobacteria bacterium]|nr:hypothetical protein [Actinomycetota bacterium]